MRAATASAREPRGERTLMGIGPEFIRREIVSNGVSGTLEGVPRERMDRTPSSPIVVEPQAALPAPTVRIPVGAPARTVRLSRAATATIERAADARPARSLTGGTPSRRLDSLVSARFFQEGEEQEANGWEDSPLVNEPFPDDEPPKFSSFDRVPRRRGPLLVTTFLLGIALVVGLAMEGGAGPARAWLAAEAGPRAVGAWNTVKDRLETGLSIRLTPESTAASSRAMVSPAAAAEPPAEAPAQPRPASAAPSAAAVAPVVVPVAPASPEASADSSSTESPSDEDLWAPLVARPATPDPAAVRRQASRNSVEVRLRRASAGEPVAAGAPSTATAPVAPREGAGPTTPTIEPKPGEVEGRAEPRHGLVWSPEKQGLVPVQPAAASLPLTGAQPPSVTDDAASSRGSDKDVLPLDDEVHTTN